MILAGASEHRLPGRDDGQYELSYGSAAGLQVTSTFFHCFGPGPDPTGSLDLSLYLGLQKNDKREKKFKK